MAIEDENKTCLSIGAVSSLWDICLNRWLMTFTDSSHDIVLNCQILSADDIRLKISNKTLDFGFTYVASQESQISVMKTLPIKFIMVSSEKNLNADDAVRKNYIDWGIAFSEVHSQYFHDMPTPLMRIDTGRIAKRFIKNKSGTAYLPEVMVKRDIENAELYTVKGAPEIKRNAYIIYNNTNERCLSMIKQLSNQGSS